MSNTEMIMHGIALALIATGVGGRLYFGHKARKLGAKLRAEWWKAHDEDVAAIRAGKMTADEAATRRKARPYA